MDCQWKLKLKYGLQYVLTALFKTGTPYPKLQNTFKNKDFIEKQEFTTVNDYIYSGAFLPPLPVVLAVWALLPDLAVFLWVAFPAFASFVVLVALGLPGAESPSLPVSAALPFGFFAGATFEAPASFSFLDFLGGFETWKQEHAWSASPQWAKLLKGYWCYIP